MIARLVGCSVLLSGSLLGATCESLSGLSLKNTTVNEATAVAAGKAAPLGTSREAGLLSSLKAFCRVALTLKPSSDSDIQVEIWMPAAGWNHKLEGNGNGGWSGAISAATLARGLARGYAVVMTDTGHKGASAEFALGHPEKLTDFGYRAVHEMTVAAKAVLAAYYGEAPGHSYWNGCSAGGRQALMEAQRYPADYDGIVAGSPAANWVGRATQAVWVAQAVHSNEAGYIPPAKYAAIHNAVLEACDAADGVKDGVLEDPTSCHFDPAAIECKEGDGPACLTPPQVEAVRKIYSSSRNPRTGQTLYSGLERGSELGWATWAGPRPLSIADGHFRYVVFQDPAWDFRTLNFDSDVARAEKLDHGTINALNPDLKPFFARGGKLIQYHGWSDPQIAPGNSVNYYQSVLKSLGGTGKVSDSYRLFMVPGMAHCGGGDGTSTFDALAALESWVEEGRAPDHIPASRMRSGSVDRRRPLCPYPQVAKYKGSGSTDDAANFTCAAK